MSDPLHFEKIPLTQLVQRGLAPDLNSSAAVILVVDDERVIADTLASILCISGYAAFSVYDAQSALEFAAAIVPDLVITDVSMPGMNGVDMAILMKKSHPQMKVLLFSGQAATADLLRAARDSGHSFKLLSKPVHPSELLANVSGMVA
jgi:DNA-binding response OmpR family regulator